MIAVLSFIGAWTLMIAVYEEGCKALQRFKSWRAYRKRRYRKPTIYR